MNIPPSLKGLTAYVKRAEELDREVTNPDSKVVAYYCRTFAVDRAIKLKAEGADVNQFLMALMTTLERDKSCIQGISQEDRKLICERFAYAIFQKADDEDRAGLADKNTAKTFYAAATFLEILEQFGELDSDAQEKKRYSKFKAADIINCIKSGVKPTIGAPGEETAEGAGSGAEDQFAASASAPLPPAAMGGYSIPAAPTEIPIAPLVMPAAPFASSSSPVIVKATNVIPPQAPIYSQPTVLGYAPAPVAAPAPAAVAKPAFTPAASGRAGPPLTAADPRAKDAIELCAFAMAALKHNDIALARERLQIALQRLG